MGDVKKDAGKDKKYTKINGVKMTNNILVTGFGPFGEHNVNASWEAVKLLPNEMNGFNIIKKEIPVLYSYVEYQVPKLWKTFNPSLVIHVGVSSHTNKLTVEKCAFRKGYNRCDCSGAKHPTGAVCCFGEDCIATGIDVDTLCLNLNNSNKIEAHISNNAGRYLCEFVFYTSLSIDKNRTLFVHVPPLEEPYSAEELAEGLLGVIKCALKQIQDSFCRRYGSLYGSVGDNLKDNQDLENIH